MEKKLTPTPKRNYELEFQYICERQKLMKYINELTEKIEKRISAVENCVADSMQLMQEKK